MAESNTTNFSTELSAPGKIIIFGEHSVVYGKKAIAATLGLYTQGSLTEDGSNNVTLKFPNIDYEESFPLSILREHFKPPEEDMDSLSFLQSIASAFGDFYNEHGKYSLTSPQRHSILTFLQSFAYFDVPCSGYVLRVETGLPLSSGAGSSASFSVVVTAALSLLHFSKTGKLSEYVERGEDGTPKVTEKLKDLIIERAYLCESIFHGLPSGIDHSVIVKGQTIEFVKGLRRNTLKTIEGSLLNILLVDTEVPRSSKKQGEILRKLKDKYPETVLNILDAIGNIANEGIGIMETLKDQRNLDKHQARLADLIELNHGLLRCVRLSHERLEKICDTAGNHGFSAKLTGAGGGGLAFVYIPIGTKPEDLENLKQELNLDGFSSYIARLGGPGLAIKSISP